MKNIILLLLLIINLFTLGQDTTYFGDNGIVLKEKSDALVYKVTIRDSNNSNKVTERYYYPNDTIKAEAVYSNYSEKILHGESKRWYESGELKEVVSYVNNEKTGKLRTYWKNGTIKRKDKYVKGKFKKGKVWNSNGKREKYYDYYQYASFDGDLGSFLSENVKYPPDAMEKGDSGKVRISFIVEPDGTITNIEILESVSKELNDEAIRVVKMMPAWIPAKRDGEPVRHRVAIPFNFNF